MFYNPYDSSSYTFYIKQLISIQELVAREYKAIGVHKVAEQLTGIHNFPSGS